MSPSPMKKKNMCVECRYCGDKTEPKSGATKRHCTHRRKALPTNVTSRPACDSFKPTKSGECWGP